MWKLMTDDFVRRSLLEDLGGQGDITTDSIVPVGHPGRGVLRARHAGVMAGGFLVEQIFTALEPTFRVDLRVNDGLEFEKGQILADLTGSARALLTGERTALNILARMCGIATLTSQVVALTEGTDCQVVCTRKTTPGLRVLEKYAVRCGGGASHRFGLDDGILIKDNHIAVAGSVEEAIRRARLRSGHMMKLEVEVDTLEQLEKVLKLGTDAVLLDNMDPGMLRQAVEMVEGRMLTEASGGISRETIAEVAATGVDLASMGSLTHGAHSLDLGLDIDV